MSKKEELEKTIKDLQSALDKAQEDLKNLDSYERFVPKVDEGYYYVDESGQCVWRENNESLFDHDIIAFYNCFRTDKEAIKEKEKILIRRQLEDIANRLNGGKKFDWTDDSQKKFRIRYYNNGKNRGWLSSSVDYAMKIEGTVYCLSNNFLNVAIEEIGEERLLKYIKGE